jgi:Zn-finger nucleic acid-binding protein
MSTENEYFAKLEAEKKARMQVILGKENAEEEASRLRELHYHHCGKCGHPMMTSHYKGVEIEVCPHCGAVLLDPGELQELAGEEHHGLLRGIAHVFGFDSRD